MQSTIQPVFVLIGMRCVMFRYSAGDCNQAYVSVLHTSLSKLEYAFGFQKLVKQKYQYIKQESLNNLILIETFQSSELSR